MSTHPTAASRRHSALTPAQVLQLAAHARRRELVVIAASAGGLSALLEIVAALPADFDTPVAIVLHRTPTPPHLLHALLGRR